MNVVWAVLLPLAEEVPDPADVKAGWVALVLFLLMGGAVVILGFSLVKHLRRARDNFDERDGVDENGTRPGTTD
jgi:hypothetical protein